MRVGLQAAAKLRALSEVHYKVSCKGTVSLYSLWDGLLISL